MHLCISERVSGKCVRALLLNCIVFTYTGAKNIGLVGKKPYGTRPLLIIGRVGHFVFGVIPV